MTINDTTLTSENLVKMMLPNNDTTGYVPMDGSGYWLRDTNQDGLSIITLNPTGNLEESSVSDQYYIIPVVHIDLTNITWQTV
mgnify:CR=1 FL=1